MVKRRSSGKGPGNEVLKSNKLIDMNL
jgi:hypothetical protein